MAQSPPAAVQRRAAYGPSVPETYSARSSTVRARNIKPGFWKNEDLVEVPFEYRLLFIGLWMLADREGRLEDRPKRIKMELFPADNVDVKAGLDELCRLGLLERYEAEGVNVLLITKFGEHQSPHHSEKRSELPGKASQTTDKVTDNVSAEPVEGTANGGDSTEADRKSTRLNSSHVRISYAVFCLKKKR